MVDVTALVPITTNVEIGVIRDCAIPKAGTLRTVLAALSMAR
jgi:hypothetical protein